MEPWVMVIGAVLLFAFIRGLVLTVKEQAEKPGFNDAVGIVLMGLFFLIFVGMCFGSSCGGWRAQVMAC